MSSDAKDDASSKEVYMASLPDHHVAPLWTVMSSMVPPKPNPRAAVLKWAYEELRPLLIKSGELVDTEEAERRVLMLVNPNMRAPYTTDTIYAGLQLILPGETARAHRHTASALRFIIEGDKGFTAVGGKKITMQKGDVILTPSWEWHDHGHDGDGPMIWLDGLDLPLFQAFPTNFAEMYQDPRYPSTPADDECDIRIPWTTARAHLDSQPGPWAIFNYTRRIGGQGEPVEISRTLGAQAERIEAGKQSEPVRETCSFVYHVYEGSGTSTIETTSGTEQITWRKGDTFAVPAWSERVHKADQGATAFLFAVNDAPLLKALGMYRKK
ncbi:hypothetical protein MCOR07_006609 [Pyricularia oryzae]|uniref:Cupin type-2 domain-containing protein n=2 Tax=Pyricularia TaxID=48558 RepID=A0ABQ8NHB5_PYRGI|nr:hypothetical protein MCOR19_001085 [Pyricularia oryzae]KAI6297091.1 hypothetical protein MCOR33_006477 [Pyricularia grisea]KAI6316683.1 hypothetical protein MCOR34_004294 [Pyricularia oryzae]KAI6330784.1 hypothetical protein MCOR29_001728 [Pyricularia oryzae]KAI6355938.1 hypothetical protein MCOR31_011040 [Pyricularia oryzae]